MRVRARNVHHRGRSGRRSTRVWGVSLLVLSLPIGLIAAACSDGAAGDAAFAQATEQTQTERTYRAMIGAAVDAFGLADSAFAPLRVLEDGAGSLFVLDQADKQIKQFDRSGNFVSAFGRCVGDGPGELGQVRSFAAAESGDILVLDQSRIVRFDSLGNPLGTIPLSTSGDDIAAGPDGTIFVHAVSSGHLLLVLDATGREIARGPYLGEDPTDWSPKIGRLVSAGDGDVVYAPMYGGYLGAYASDLSERYFVETIVPFPFPETKREGEDTVSLNTGESGFRMPISVVDDTLFALHAPRDADYANLDAYDYRDGSYLYSVRIGEGCSPVFVSREHVYLLCEDGTVRKHGRR